MGGFSDMMYDDGFTDPEEYMEYKINEYLNQESDYNAQSNNSSWEEDEEEDFDDYEEMSDEECSETTDILDMFRKIRISIYCLPVENQIKFKESLNFDGFDLSNPHYDYCDFLVNTLNLFPEFKDTPLNSNDSISIEKYREMLTYVNKNQNSSYLLPSENLNELLNIVNKF